MVGKRARRNLRKCCDAAVTIVNLRTCVLPFLIKSKSQKMNSSLGWFSITSYTELIFVCGAGE